MSKFPLYYFEDVDPNKVLDTPAMTMTEAHGILFRGITQEPGEPGQVPDLLPLCVTTGLGWRVPQAPLAVMAFLGFEWQILRPLRVGDPVYSRARTVTKRPMRDGGIIIEAREVIDQHGETVQRGRFTFLVAKRPVPAGA